MRLDLRTIAICVLPVVTACAPPKMADPGANPVDRVRVNASQDPNDISYTPAGASASNAPLPYPARLAWEKLPSVYTVLSIPVSNMDNARRRAAGSFAAQRSFAHQPLSNFVDCGSSLVGSNADSYRVNLVLTTQVDSAAPVASRVRTLLEATGTGTGGATVRCSSTGELEQRIVTLLRESLSR